MSTLRQQLAQLDPRVLRLALVAALLMVLLVGWGQVLRPAWQTRQSAASQLADTRRIVTELPARRARADALERETAALERQLDAPDTAPTRLPTQLENLARAHRIELQPVFPGQETEFEGLRETRYELDASGSYPQLVAWLAAIETRLANVGIQEARFIRQPGGEAVGLHLRLAVYRRPGADTTPP